jgi:CRISPR-associated protein Csx17
VPDLRLRGCASRPLVGYLKALGVLRTVGRQADPTVRARWVGGTFELRSTLDGDALAGFFLEEYKPAPVVSPWNGGSGFHPKDRQEALRAIEETTGARFDSYRLAIAAARKSLEELGLSEKPDQQQKEALIRSLRRTAPDDALSWLDAAVVVREDGLAFPPLLGSGGNDGRFDFSNNYAHCVVACLLDNAGDRSTLNLATALSGAPSRLETKLSLAHLYRDSSPNNSPYGEADSLGNPWDLILAVEGALIMTAGVTRRHGSNLPNDLAAPFTVRQTNAGYGSAVEGESGRAELWLPLWDRWASLGELTALVREARAQVGGARRRKATTGLDFARAAGELGVARGVSAFERYALVERAGQSTLAVPTGRITVEDRKSAKALDGIESWLESLERLAHDERCPQGPRIAIRRLRKAAIAMAGRDDPGLVCATLEAIGGVEGGLSRSRTAGEKVWPLTGAPAEPWIAAADDGTPEFAVAVAIASLRSWHGSTDLPELRDYLHGTKRGSNGTERDPERRHAVTGNDPFALLAAIGARRHLDAGRAGQVDASGDSGNGSHGKRTQLDFSHGIWAALESVRLFVANRLDNERILTLVRGLSLLRYTGAEPAPQPKLSKPVAPHLPLELLELAWRDVLPQGRDDSTRDERIRRGAEPANLGARPGWAARLAAGATRAVIEDAARRLLMAGLPPKLTPSDLAIDPSRELPLGRRLGAALLVHLVPRDIRSLTRAQVLSEEEDDQHSEGAP